MFAGTATPRPPCRRTVPGLPVSGRNQEASQGRRRSLRPPNVDGRGWTNFILPRSRMPPAGTSRLRKRFDLPGGSNEQLVLTLGTLATSYEGFVNGKNVPYGRKEDLDLSLSGSFTLPGGLLHPGENVVALPIFVTSRNAGSNFQNLNFYSGQGPYPIAATANATALKAKASTQNKQCRYDILAG